MRHLSLILCCGILLSFGAKAQSIRLSDNPQTFISEIKTVMAAEKNPIAIAMGDKFESYWTSRFTDSQKNVLRSTTKRMGLKGHKMAQFYYLFLLIDKVISQENFDNAKLDDFLIVTQKTVEQYDLKTATRVFETFKDFLEKRRVYASGFNRLYALGGTFDFRFLTKAQEIAQAAQPVSTANTPSSTEDSKYFDGWDTPPTTATQIPAGNGLQDFDKKPMPILTGVVIELNNTDLIMATASDSVAISKTSGTIALKDGVFVGKGGVLTWDNLNLPQISAALADYTFDIRNPRFTAEDVSFTYAERLTAPIKGVLEFKGEKRAKNVQASYPRFMSYQGDAFIKNIDKSVEYKGGFSIIGKRIFSSSVHNSYSYITVKQDGKVAFKTSSTRFEINDLFINAQLASFVTYIGQDSIYHPAVKLNYIPADGLLKLNKIESGSYKDVYYIDSYHQLSMKCDAMRWNLAEGKMDFYIVSGKTQVPAVFESLDFFDSQRLGRLNGGGNFNPLLVASSFAQKNNKHSFSVQEVAAFNNNRVSAQNLKSGFVTAEQQGFLYYNPTTDLYSITRKGQHYLAANTGKKDFDDLLIPSIYGSSKDSTANASLNLTDKSLLIRGVKRFNLSDSLGSYVLPYDGIVNVGKNRTFTFNGQLKAKNFRFSGKELVLNYEKYMLTLPKIDSITFTPPDAYAKGATKEIGSKFKYDNAGVVYLNKPDNKSGRINFPQYPILKIDKGVIVYFDDAYRGNRAYNREVRFEVPKIDFDSLNVKPMEFSGTFYSGNIFKPFKEKLTILSDTTIGFSHKAPGGKYTVYGNETSVKFASELVMDDKGLHTTGDITHLAATLTSDEIFFFTDSLTAKGKVGKVVETTKPGTYYPKIEVKDYTLKWTPKADSMLIASHEGFDFYQASSSLKGKILLRKTGLFGMGNLIRDDSETGSEQFKFNKEGFIADNSQFKIKATSPLIKAVLLAKHVDINFNITKSLVNFAGNEGNSFNDTTRQSSLEFPYAAYRTNINKAEWNIKKKQVSMKGDAATTLFASTNAAQEGLSYNGSSAVYDIEQLTLNIGGVPFIQSADARIMPDKGLVAIRKDAEMLPFKKARLTIDTLNGYHNLSNGNIQILSKSRFIGDASYQFVNVRKDTFNIKMGDFELREVKLAAAPDGKKTKEKGYSTFAHAIVRDRDSVYLSPKIIYQGEISMSAPVKNLTMDGFVLPVLKKYPKLGGYWIPYKGDKSEEVVITVDKNLKSDDAPLWAGLHLRTTVSSNGLYPTFLSAKETDEDQDVFVASGVLRRDEPNKLFSIKPEDPKATAVNKYELIEDQGIINLEGKFNLLNKELAQYMKASGFARLRLDSAKHQFNTMMLVNFPVAQPILAHMATKIVKTNLDLGVNEAAIELNSPELISKISHIVGDKDIEDYKLRSAKEYVPLFKFSPKFINTVVFSDLQLAWEPKQNAYRSVGKLGISNIGETDINAKVDGYVEIRKNPVTGDEVYVFIELSPESWYYMGYKEGEMGIISSDDAFNALVTKGERKKDRGYQVIAVDHSEAILFRKMFLETYRGLKEPPKGAKVDPKKLAEAPKEATQKKDDKKKKVEAEKDGF